METTIRARRVTRRIFDLVVSLALLPLATPLCLLLMLAIRAETPGPALFRQVRVGRDRRPFRMIKLRTMLRDTGDLPSHEVGANRITRVGRVLRRLKLDELPQLANVLAGSMSLVGPRPCLPSQRELIDQRDARGLFALRPGVTGPAQLHGIDMSDPVRLAETEEAYFVQASLRHDLGIIVRTFAGGGSGDAAPGLSQQPTRR